ncbi:hypothetical protein CLU79DRAFT_70761 [Phycomyces nitens]|nr:hypothetical protein CLU79DRAFT_70761 [Phycomyces nitens]
MDSCSPKPMSPYYTSQPSSAFPWPAPSPPSTKHSSHSPSNEVTIKEILDRYKDNPELLKHVLIAKAEEDKRQAAEDTLKTEQARIHLRQMDIDFIREQTKLGRSMSEKTHYPSHPQKYQVSYYGLAPVQQQVLARITGSDTTYQSYSPPSISEPYPHSPSPPVYPHSAHPLCPAPIPSYYPHTHYHAPAPASASILDNRSSSSSNSSSNNTHNNIFRPSHLQARHHPLPQQQQQSHPTITTSPASKSAEARPAASLPAHSVPAHPVPAHPVSAHPVPTHSVPASPLDQESRKRSRQSISAGKDPAKHKEQ